MSEFLKIERRLPNVAIGWVTRFDNQIDTSDATKEVVVSGGDTYGAQKWNKTTLLWEPMTLADRIAGIVWNETNVYPNGIFDIAIAPSNTQIQYKAWTLWIYKSTDGGATWTRTTLTKDFRPNHHDRMGGRRIAVHPTNPNIVVVATHHEGEWLTTNGGTTWTQISGPAASTGTDGAPQEYENNRCPLVCFRPTSPYTLYIAHPIAGVYSAASTDYATATLMAGSPVSLVHMEAASNGTVWTTETGAGPIRKCVAGTWSASHDDNNQFYGIAIHPADPVKVTITADGGQPIYTTDEGATWDYRGPFTRIANDIKVLTYANGNGMSPGQLRHSKIAPYDLYFSEGLGVWTTPAVYSNAAFNWTSMTLGIDQHCTQELVWPPAYIDGDGIAHEQPLYRIGQDKAAFCHTIQEMLAGTPPTKHGVSNQFPLSHGWSGDYAKTDSRFVAVIAGDWNGSAETSGYTEDSGKTWTRFPTTPTPAAGGGTIAVYSPQVMIWVPNQNLGHPSFTVDKGTTWNPVPVTGLGLPTSGELGWGFNRYHRRRIATADHVTPNTFYLYNYGGSGYESTAGIYKIVITGSSAVMTKVGAPTILGGFNTHLRSVPGFAGHLFLSGGHVGGDGGSTLAPLLRSVNGGAAWSEPWPSLKEAWDFAIGKGPFGSTYPTIYATAYKDGEQAIELYQMDSLGAPVKVTERVANWLDDPNVAVADMENHGRVSVGFGGSGGAWVEKINSRRMN